MSRSLAIRWLRFNSVGLLGAGVHLSSLAFFTYVLGLNYVAATVLAIETAVVHNFVWHQNWTWRDRPVRRLRDTLDRLLRFHLSNGLTSVLGNLIIMQVLVGHLGVPVLISGGGAICLCAIANFMFSNRLVFRGTEDGIQHSESGAAPGRGAALLIKARNPGL